MCWKKEKKPRPEQRGSRDPLTKRVSLPAYSEPLEEWLLGYGWEERSKGSTVKTPIREQMDGKGENKNKTMAGGRQVSDEVFRLLTGWIVGE